MKKSKVILALVCAVLLVCASVLGTLAYLTSTDTVTNTFTVGNVTIELDEAKVNGDGKPVNGQDIVVDNLASAKRVKANTYKLMPGHSYTKDPTVTVKANSEASYIRIMVTVKFDKLLTDIQLATELDGIFTGYAGTTWDRTGKTVTTTDNKTTIVYEYRYYTTEEGGTTKNYIHPAVSTDTKLDALFTGFTVPNNWTATDLTNIGGFTLTAVAQAIQADGFTDKTEDGVTTTAVDAAWTAFEGAAS